MGYMMKGCSDKAGNKAGAEKLQTTLANQMLILPSCLLNKTQQVKLKLRALALDVLARSSSSRCLLWSLCFLPHCSIVSAGLFQCTRLYVVADCSRTTLQ